jgi:hypothetical protein
MSVTIGTTTIAANSTSTELFAPVSAACQVTLVAVDNTAFLANIAGLTAPVGAEPMPENMAPILLTGSPWQLNLAEGDTLYVAPYADGTDLHVNYIITT